MATYEQNCRTLSRIEESRLSPPDEDPDVLIVVLKYCLMMMAISVLNVNGLGILTMRRILMLTKEFIKEKLITDQRWLMRGITAIYEKQTWDEQQSEMTKEDNGVGFNGVDAYILSSFAKQLKQGRTLSSKQLLIARKKMPKYARQLLQIAKEKGNA